MRIALTVIALIAFAANSLLCRMSLAAQLVDPSAFTAVRLLSGAVVLVALSVVFGDRTGGQKRIGGSWRSAVALFVYALAFSWAYLRLEAGTGALVLFGAVQATMIGAGMFRGERPRLGEWLGLAAAMTGLVVLGLPGLRGPSPWIALMALAGVAWGVYSLRGHATVDAVRDTAGNFVRAVPLAALAFAAPWGSFEPHARGIVLAVISGAVTSGLGYVIWYRALRELSATTAAIVQLLVPVLAAAGGVLVLAERPTLRLLVAGLAILGGVLAAILSRR